jgi:hypothetical protein
MFNLGQTKYLEKNEGSIFQHALFREYSTHCERSQLTRQTYNMHVLLIFFFSSLAILNDFRNRKKSWRKSKFKLY